jgi:predicted ArsR family transcriptional regulator
MAQSAEEVSTRERVLTLVLEQGPVCAADVAEELELTPAAVRRHIGALEGQGLIQVQQNPGTFAPRRGRPARYYVATDAGRAEFSNAYSDLAVQLLAFMRERGGDEMADLFADRRQGELERQFADRIDPDASVQERAEALAHALTEDGYAFSHLLGVHVQRLATIAGGGYMCTTHVPLALPTRQTTHPTEVGTEGI